MNALVEQAVTIWLAGGWAMIALALNAMILFAVGIHLWVHLSSGSVRSVPERTWKRWLREPSERRGRVGELVSFLTSATSLKDLARRMEEVHGTMVAPYGRDLRFMRRAVGTAPLLGLLGTVTGMLSTFQGLALGSGGDKTLDLVASGISEALITTETGLLIAIPGLFFQFHLARERDRYAAFLAHLETACAQFLWRSRFSPSATRGAGVEP